MARYRFEDIAFNITDKRTPTPEDKELYIGLEHLDTRCLRVSRWGSAVDITGQKLIMRKGDVLFGRRNTYLRRAAIAPHDGLFSAHGMIFRPKTDVITEEFFPYFIVSNYFMDAAIRISVGSLSPTVNWKQLKELEFDIPDTDKQHKYAEFFAAIDRAKEAYKQLIVSTDELVKSQFIEMFGADEFPVCTLSEECALITKGTTPTTIGFNFANDGVNFVKIENIDEHGNFNREGMMSISETCHEVMKRSQLKEDDILFSIAGAIGRCAVVSNDILPANINQALAIIRLKKESVLDRKFVMAALKSDYVIEQYMELKRGVAQLNLSLKNIGDFRVPVPPIDAQKRYVAFVEQSDKSKFETKKALELLDVLYQNMEKQCFY